MSEATNHVMENDGNTAGVFVNDATIVAARSISNEDIFKNGKPIDVGIEFKLDIGKDFQPMFSVYGNFKIDADGNVKDSSATKVKIALQNLKVKWTKLNPDNSIPQDVLDQCIGKAITRLQFPYAVNQETSKPKYKTFDYFLLAGTPDAKTKIRAKFDAAVQGGYVKTISEDTSFPPAPSAAEALKTEAQF
jgi:hypothetical protein